MIETVTTYVRDNTTPELADDLLDAWTILEQFNYPDMETTVEAFLFMDDESSPGDTMEAIVESTRAMLHNTLKQHTITFSAETTIEVLVNLLQAIKVIPDFEDKKNIIALCSSELNSREVFCELVALALGRQMEEYLIYAEEVGDVLIKRIKEMAAQNLPPDDDSAVQEVRKKYIDDYRFYLNYIMQQPLLITDYIKDGMMPGYPFTVYADMIGRGFEGMYPLRAAQELIGIALVSSDGNLNPRETIASKMETYISSVNFTTSVLIEVDKLLLGYKR